MPSYALWNNKGGVGKSYLTFQIACQYAITHPNQTILVLDLCPQANASIMLLGGMERGAKALDDLSAVSPKKTISGYIEDRLRTPYASPKTGSTYLIKPSDLNRYIPENVLLVAGDEELEIQSSRVSNANRPGPPDAWRIVHSWVADLVSDIKDSINNNEMTVFIDCNPSFTVYTELALSAADRLIIPFSADGSSKRAVRAVLALIYGLSRNQGTQQSEYSLNSKRDRLTVPEVYCYVGNILTKANSSSAKAFRSVVSSIGEEIWKVWITQPSLFCIHPSGTGAPSGKRDFKAMFQAEISDANTASVVSGALGIPITKLTSGDKKMPDGSIAHVNDSQLQQQQPSIREFVKAIE